MSVLKIVYNMEDFFLDSEQYKWLEKYILSGNL